jgi:polyketide synthase 12
VLQSVLLTEGPSGLPFSWRGVTRHADAGTAVRAWLSMVDDRIALHVTDETGLPVLTADSLLVRPVDPNQLTGGGDLYRVNWTPLPDPSAGPDEDIALCHAIASSADPTATHALTATVLDAVRTTLAGDGRLAVITSDVVSTGAADPVTDLAAAAVWGLVRSAQTEHPDRFVLLDTDTTDDTAIRAALAAGEPQLALRDGTVHIPRLVRADRRGQFTGTQAVVEPDRGDSAPIVVPLDTPWRLAPSEGSLDRLSAVPWPEMSAPLAAGEVRVAVRAAGLNFRDVLVALGMVDDGRHLGGEAAGVVVEVAPDVTTVVVGERVMGVVGGIGATVVTDHRLLTRVPAGWSFTQAAATPVAFLTAYYALHDLAHAQPGQKILIHAATGGVGMAALQLAAHLELEVFATASPAKWDTLRDFGIDEDHIASTRDLTFADKFPHVDIVLNALAGEFTDASLTLLEPGGTFLEMGKTDIRDANNYPEIRYHAFDMPEAGPDRIHDMLTALTELFASNNLHPMPVQAWPVQHAPEAFRHFSQAKHTGKLALTLPQRLDPNGTVLITGGTGTLGQLLAHHLVRTHGIRHLILASRTGTTNNALRQLGATITTCDVTDPDAVTALIDNIPSEHPLTAVIHAAGVIDDAIVDNLTPDRLTTVLKPKVDAAWHLHHATRHLDLAAFIYYSSASGTLGSAGQSAYAAANAYLDAFATHRQQQGLPALSLAWGLWADTSDMTSNVDLTRLGRGGILPMAADHAHELFDAALTRTRPTLVPALLNQAALRAQAANGDLPAILSGLVRTSTRRAGTNGSWRRRLDGADGTDRDRLLLGLVRGEAAAVLGHHDDNAIEPERGLMDLGFDSLTAVELRNRLSSATELRLPTTLVFDHPTAAALAGYLGGQLAPATADSLPLLDELEQVERRLDTLSSEARGRLTARLQAFLSTVDAMTSGSDGDVTKQLDSATDDEIFQFIDNELGVSRIEED